MAVGHIIAPKLISRRGEPVHRVSRYLKPESSPSSRSMRPGYEREVVLKERVLKREHLNPSHVHGEDIHLFDRPGSHMTCLRIILEYIRQKINILRPGSPTSRRSRGSPPGSNSAPLVPEWRALQRAS